MKILEKATTPDGIDIQIEDWSDTYSFMNILSIGVYPTAKQSDTVWIIPNERFRMSLDKFKSDSETLEVFRKLKNGNYKLEDLTEHFEEKTKNMYYLGLSSKN